MKYFILALIALVLCVAVVALSMRRRREVDRVRRAELARMRERAHYAEATIDAISDQVSTWSTVDHVLAGGLEPILITYKEARLARAQQRENAL